MKKLSNIEAELKKSVAYKQKCVSHMDETVASVEIMFTKKCL